MTITRRQLLGATASIALSPVGFTALAQQAASPDLRAATLTEPTPTLPTPKDIQEAYDQWLTASGFVDGPNEQPDGSTIYVFSGVATVTAKPTSKEWVDSKSLAFNRAELSAKAKMAFAISQEITTQRAASAGRVTGSASPATDPKTGADTPDLSLDAQISKSEEQTTRQANIFLSGSFVAAQFNGPNADDGKYGVLAAIISSPKLEQLALSVLDPSVTPPPQAPGLSLREFISKQRASNPSWAMECDGVRVLTNEKGQRIILGFGHAITSSVDASIHEGIASSNATAAIVRFISEKILAGDKNEKKEAIRVSDAKDDRAFLATYERETKGIATTVRLTGGSTISVPASLHPEGQVRVYTSIVAWTPDGSIAARKMALRAKAQETEINANARNNITPGGAAQTPGGNATGLSKGPAQTGVKSGLTVNPTQF